MSLLPNVTPDARRWALFLDVDGTLLEIAETPESVVVPDELKTLLRDLSVRLDGALALISGRSIQDLDRLFAPLRLCASGIHGCERREADGRIVTPGVDPVVLEPIRAELQRYADRQPGLLLEDKGYGLALHFRRAPHLGGDVATIMRRLCERLGPGYTLQSGKCVLEIRPSGFTKGSSIAAFMEQPPFAGRTPVFLGDDVTDEDGFAAVNDLGGLSIKVGATSTATMAKQRLAGVREVHQWLQRLPPRVLEGA